MELRIVSKPMQDEHTLERDVKYPNESWCVKTFICRESDGGMNLFFKEIERVDPDIVYLYEIKSWKDKIVNEKNREDYFEDTFYKVRFEFKKNLVIL